MTAQQIIDRVVLDLSSEPDMTDMSFIETVFCIGIMKIYTMYSHGLISRETGSRLKAKLIRELELWRLYEEIYIRHLKAEKEVSAKGVKLTKLLKSKGDTEEILDAALDVLNSCGINGGVPWERSKRNTNYERDNRAIFKRY